tara:strand:+ start:139 stop:594 length:456 start_codon:yes stop_codon:yes gene_type:complete
MDINKVTLECLINPSLYKKLHEKNESSNIDKNFYKQRILKLTENIFDTRSDNNCLNKVFDNYIQECITYLYSCDKNDEFQQCYSDISFSYDISYTDISDSYIDSSFNIDKNLAKKKSNKITKFINKKTHFKHVLPQKKSFNHLDNKYKNKI